jgi:hypothetical protein
MFRGSYGHVRLDRSPSGQVFLALDGTLLFANAAFRRLEHEVTTLVEKLLAQPATAQSAKLD